MVYSINNEINILGGRMLTIAYIGNGKSANRYHLPFSRQIEGIKVKSIYERSKSNWKELRD